MKRQGYLLKIALGTRLERYDKIIKTVDYAIHIKSIENQKINRFMLKVKAWST